MPSEPQIYETLNNANKLHDMQIEQVQAYRRALQLGFFGRVNIEVQIEDGDIQTHKCEVVQKIRKETE